MDTLLRHSAYCRTVDLNKPFLHQRKIQEADCAGRETKAGALLGRHREANLDEGSTGCFMGETTHSTTCGGRRTIEGVASAGVDPRFRKMKR